MDLFKNCMKQANARTRPFKRRFPCASTNIFRVQVLQHQTTSLKRTTRLQLFLKSAISEETLELRKRCRHQALIERFTQTPATLMVLCQKRASFSEIKVPAVR